MYTKKDLRKIQKPVLPVGGRIFDPIAEPLVLLIANYTNLTPTMLSLINIVVSFISAYYFYTGKIITGALLFALAFLFDCMDGNLARLKSKTSRLGMFLEVNGDKIRVILPLLGMTHYYYSVTNDISIFYWAYGFLATNLFFQFAEAFMGYQSARKGYDKRYVVTDTNAQSKISIGSIRSFLQKRRMDLIYTTLDQEKIVLLIFPLLSYFNFTMIKYGYIVGTVSYALWVALIKYPRQIKKILLEDRNGQRE